MNDKYLYFQNERGNFYFGRFNLNKKTFINLVHKNLEFKLLFVSKNFSDYLEEKVEKNIELIIGQRGLTHINFFGLGATKLEDIAENKIVNLWMEKNDEKILSIVVSSEENLKEDGFFYAFKYGGFSIKDENEHVKENYIFYDDNELYELIIKLL